MRERIGYEDLYLKITIDDYGKYVEKLQAVGWSNEEIIKKLQLNLGLAGYTQGGSSLEATNYWINQLK